MPEPWPVPVYGGCACGALRYRVDRTPLFVHCCNCHACQRETGSAFALNAMVETDAVTIVPGDDGNAPSAESGGKGAVVQPKMVVLPSRSGRGQLSVRCPRCYTTVWTYYGGAGPYVAFLKAGALDKVGADGKSLEDVLKPDVFIYAKFKQPWLNHNEDIKSAEEFYDREATWPPDTAERFKAIWPQTQAWMERGAKWEEAGEGVVNLQQPPT